MTAPYMRGLLDDGQTPFNAGLPPGLLEMIGQPGKPGANMVQNMQMLGGMSGGRAAGGMRSAPEQVTAPPMAPPAPMPGAAPPQQEAPSMATNNALMYGGMAGMKAAQGGNQGSLGASLGEALAAGTAAFTATKDAEKDRADALKMQDQFARTVRGLGLDAATREGIIAMGPVAGAKLLAEHGISVANEKAKAAAQVHNVQPGAKLFRADGTLIAENIKANEPFDIAKMSTDMRDALMVVLQRDPRNGEAFGAPLSDEEKTKVEQYLAAQARAKATNVSVNTGGPGANEGIKRLWDKGVELLGTEYITIKPLTERIRLYDQIIEQAEEGQYKFGSLAEQRQSVAKFAQMIGLSVDTESVTNTDVLMSRLREAALQELKRLDSRPTDKDMEILLQKIGQLGTDPAALIQIARDNQAMARRQAADFNSRLRAQTEQFQSYGYDTPAYIQPVEVPETREQTNLQDAFLGVAGFRPRGK
jgi:hypothetical protein